MSVLKLSPCNTVLGHSLEFAPQVDSLQLFKQALAEGISLAPGPIFSATRSFTHCARLNYGHPWNSTSEAAMQVLGRLLADCKAP